MFKYFKYIHLGRQVINKQVFSEKLAFSLIIFDFKKKYNRIFFKMPKRRIIKA